MRIHEKVIIHMCVNKMNRVFSNASFDVAFCYSSILAMLSDADALTTTEALDALARICTLATMALPVKAEVERAAILSVRRWRFGVGCENGPIATRDSEELALPRAKD